MFFFVNLFCFEIEKRLENCFYKEDRLISFRNCIEIFSGFWSKNKKGFFVYRRIYWYNSSKDKKM